MFALFTLHPVGNGFVRSVCGMHKCISYTSLCHYEDNLLPAVP